MASINEKLLQAVLSLPSDQRATLVDYLLKSLNVPIQPEIEKAWAEEVERRVKEIKDNKAELVDDEKVFDDIRKRLRK
ncbi:MAG: addiction module protein [Candidatus Hodarchaeota archaeon]